MQSTRQAHTLLFVAINVLLVKRSNALRLGNIGHGQSRLIGDGL